MRMIKRRETLIPLEGNFYMDTTTDGVSIQDRIQAYLSPEPIPKETQEPAQEAPQEEIQEAQSLEPEAESSYEEPEAEEESQGANDEGETLELSDLAQYLGIDEDKLDLGDEGVFIKTKIDGEEGRAKFTDLIKSYQLEGHLNKQNIAATERQKALEEREAQVEQAASQKLNQLEDLSKMAYNKLLSDYNRVNWQELREEDPAEYSAKQNDFQRAQTEINQAYSQVQAERRQQQAKSQENHQSYLAQEATKLVEAIPGWSDAEVASKEKTEVATYATNKLGFKPDEISNIGDHRIVAMMRKAMLYDQMQSKKPTIEKKVKKAPKLVKPGQQSSNKDRNATSLQKAKDRIKKSGGKSGVTDYLVQKGII
jgi:hypothetical protein